MEIFGTTGLFIDHLLDFSSDIQDEDDGDSSNNNHHSSKPSNPRLTESDSLSMLIEEEEEELEWLLNRDIFPPVETSEILCENKTKNHSPVSVLGSGSFQVPVQARSKRRRKRRNFSDLSGQQWWWFEPKKKRAEALAMTTSSFIRKCQHCQTEETPQWRAGPLGPKTLCNACGVRYKSGRLLPEYRPANSPTFSSRLHSNSHRKVLDMRRQKQKDILPLLDKRLVG